jgi:uncharacterized protein (TIGR02145 family)
MRKRNQIYPMAIGLILIIVISCKKEDQSLPILKTSDVTNILQTAVVCGGDITFDVSSTVIIRGVCWGLGSNPTIEDSKTTDGTGAGSYTSIISGLEPNTTYYTRAYATNNKGTKYGQEVSFTTLIEDGFVGTITDNEGNVYQTVYIGGKVWMTENLRTLHYNNGSLIPTNLNDSDWGNTTNGACSIYPYDNEFVSGINSDDVMRSFYGVLYNWHAISDSRGISPSGWHIATDEDWTGLINYITLKNGTNISNRLKSCYQVNSPLGGNCTTTNHPRWNADVKYYGLNSSLFSALPSGGRNGSGSFVSFGYNGLWWTSTETNSSEAKYIILYNSLDFIGREDNAKTLGFSVRCVKN